MSADESSAKAGTGKSSRQSRYNNSGGCAILKLAVNRSCDT